ncbi:MAG: hypothetical protein RRY40_01285 [Oscillospiraceae bacterium]
MRYNRERNREKNNENRDNGDVRNVKTEVYEYSGEDYEKDKWYEDNNQVNPKWEQDEGSSWVDDFWNSWLEKTSYPTKGDKNDREDNNWGGSGSSSGGGSWGNNNSWSGGGSWGSGSNGGGGYNPPTTPDNSYLEQQKAALEQAKREAEAARKGAYDTANKQLDDMTAKSEQQAYLNRKKQEKTLPSALAMNGYSGGASESALNDIGSVYQNALNSIKDTKAEELGRLTANLQAGVAADNGAYDVKIAENLGEADRRQREWEQMNYERERQKRLDEQAKRESDALIAAKMQELDAKKQSNANKNSGNSSWSNSGDSYGGNGGTGGWMNAPAEELRNDAQWEGTAPAEELDDYSNAADLSYLKTINQQLRGFENTEQAKAYLQELQLSNRISMAQYRNMVASL